MSLTTSAPDPSQKAVRAAQQLRVVFSRLRRRLRELTPGDDLTPSQLAVLVELGKNGPATASQLAAREGMTGQSMSAKILALEALGYLERTTDPSDGRRLLLSLTDAGRARHAGDREAREEWLARLLQQCDESELDTLLAALELLDGISLT